jgi:hypothetical protein
MLSNASEGEVLGCYPKPRKGMIPLTPSDYLSNLFYPNIRLRRFTDGFDKHPIADLTTIYWG